MKRHKSLTRARIFEACERSHSSLDNPGFCIHCGVEVDGVDSDAEGDECEECGEDGVYGAEALLLAV